MRCVIILRILHNDITAFLDCISKGIDVLTNLYPTAVLCVLGDFNQLDTTFLQCEFGLTQIVDTPTHGNNLLDKVFINVGYKTQVSKSLVKTKHRTVLVVPCSVPYCVPNKRQNFTYIPRVRKKEATLFSTTTIAFLGRFL